MLLFAYLTFEFCKAEEEEIENKTEKTKNENETSKYSFHTEQI